MSRRLAAFSAKKQERMKYADPNDHQFNWSSKFVNRGVYENVYPSSYGRPADREPKILPKLSNLDVEEEDELINAMQEIGVHEKELKDAKIKLVRCSDFNLVDGFQTVDALGKGFVTAPQLQNALEAYRKANALEPGNAATMKQLELVEARAAASTRTADDEVEWLRADNRKVAAEDAGCAQQ